MKLLKNKGKIHALCENVYATKCSSIAGIDVLMKRDFDGDLGEITCKKCLKAIEKEVLNETKA